MSLDDPIRRETNRVMRRTLFRATRPENCQIPLATFDDLVQEIVAWAELPADVREQQTRRVARRVLDIP